MAAPMEEKNLQSFELILPKIDENGDGEATCPEKRSGHRIGVTNKALYSVGGFNPGYWTEPNDDYTIYPLFRELWKFNINTQEWNQQTTTGDMPVELASHAALLVGNRLLVHGGTGTPFGHASSNRLHVCNLTTLEWHQVACSGDVPEELYGHSLSLANDVIFMFGGTTGYEYSNDLHRLSLDTFTWHKFDVEEKGEEKPEGRYRHEAVHDRLTNRLYIMGGGRAYTSYGFEELDAFDVDSQKWLKIQSQSNGRQGYPEARRCHSCVLFKNNAYICGGYNGETIFSDLWKLDLETLYWCKITDMPKPVYFHAADVSPSGCMYIFGGVNQIDLVRNSNIYKIWLQPPSLQETCWMKICNLIKDIEKLPRPMLAQIGVPLGLLERLM